MLRSNLSSHVPKEGADVGLRFFSGGRHAFTLIELLIVIAIILILIAIALPNFLEAQIRARVTKAKGEIRTLGIAYESYYIDFKVYPAESEHNILTDPTRGWNESGLKWLTTPIKYITSIPFDPFPGVGEEEDIITYEAGGCEVTGRHATATWVIFSRGPDNIRTRQGHDVVSDNPTFAVPPDGSVDSYSPTNGTSSNGDIFLYGGDSLFIGVSLSNANNAYAHAPGHISNGGLGLVVDHVSYIHRMPPPLR
jgi:prepilin-type N-terminal cleavage/methylation domain-containing protein